MWVKIIGVLGVIPGVPLGPVVTVVLVLVFKNEAKASKPALTVPEA
jgi:hypothetical protein